MPARAELMSFKDLKNSSVATAVCGFCVRNFLHPPMKNTRVKMQMLYMSRFIAIVFLEINVYANSQFSSFWIFTAVFTYRQTFRREFRIIPCVVCPRKQIVAVHVHTRVFHS